MAMTKYVKTMVGYDEKDVILPIRDTTTMDGLNDDASERWFAFLYSNMGKMQQGDAS